MALAGPAKQFHKLMAARGGLKLRQPGLEFRNRSKQLGVLAEIKIQGVGGRKAAPFHVWLMVGLFAYPIGATLTVPGKIQMKMVLMVAICFWPQNGGKIAAGAGIDGSQKLALGTWPVPALGHSDGFAVGKSESTDVDCIAVAMFGKFRAFNTVARTAGE